MQSVYLSARQIFFEKDIQTKHRSLTNDKKLKGKAGTLHYRNGQDDWFEYGDGLKEIIMGEMHSFSRKRSVWGSTVREL